MDYTYVFYSMDEYKFYLIRRAQGGACACDTAGPANSDADKDRGRPKKRQTDPPFAQMTYGTDYRPNGRTLQPAAVDQSRSRLTNATGNVPVLAVIVISWERNIAATRQENAYMDYTLYCSKYNPFEEDESDPGDQVSPPLVGRHSRKYSCSVG